MISADQATPDNYVNSNKPNPRILREMQDLLHGNFTKCAKEKNNRNGKSFHGEHI